VIGKESEVQTLNHPSNTSCSTYYTPRNTDQLQQKLILQLRVDQLQSELALIEDDQLNPDDIHESKLDAFLPPS
jgi:hypothetical protein